MDNEKEPIKTGIYENTVQRITESVKPRLHKITQDFVDKSVEKHAPDNPRFAKMIEFEVRRRGDGAGMTQDVAEPMLWAGIKTAAAVPIAMLAHYVEKGKFKFIGYGAAVGLVLNNGIELLRLLPRYKAGLQGSLEMAKDRWESLQETGVDPFNNQLRPREINKGDTKEPEFTKSVQKKLPVAPASLLEKAEKSKEQPTSPHL